MTGTDDGPDGVTIDATLTLDTGALAVCAANLGPTCDHCGAAWTLSAYLTRGGRGKSLSAQVRGRCPECGADERISTHVDVDVEFDVAVAGEEESEEVAEA